MSCNMINNTWNLHVLGLSMHVSTCSSHAIGKALPCHHGAMPEVAEMVILCLRLDSQGTRHGTENTNFKCIVSQWNLSCNPQISDSSYSGLLKTDSCAGHHLQHLTEHTFPLAPYKGAKLRHNLFQPDSLGISLLDRAPHIWQPSTWAGFLEPLLIKLLYFASRISNTHFNRSWNPNPSITHFLSAFFFFPNVLSCESKLNF